MDNLSTSVIGGSVSNFIFVLVFSIFACIKQRVKKCDSDCDLYCFHCQSEMQELAKNITNRQESHEKQMKQLMEQLAQPGALNIV